jgi:phosphatidylglycerol---prolipoprotein diacylglyceryl transferase
MHPKLFTIGPLTIYSYGLMLGIGFILASIVLTKELQRRGLDSNLGSTITLLAIVFGIAGSKLLYLIENWNYAARDPFGMAFSPGGLTWYGGFILATIAIMLYVRRRKVPFLTVCDAASPSLLLGYGVARIGCHLSGDGDYGMPTDLPWASVYSDGTYPPSLAFKNFPEIVQKYGVNGVVPDTIPVHPAPLYEFLIGLLLFILVWRVRKKFLVPGTLFMLYLILSGTARFLVEFIRLNPRILFGLSEAQLIAIVMVAAGIAGYFYLSRKQADASPAS